MKCKEPSALPSASCSSSSIHSLNFRVSLTFTSFLLSSLVALIRSRPHDLTLLRHDFFHGLHSPESGRVLNWHVEHRIPPEVSRNEPLPQSTPFFITTTFKILCQGYLQTLPLNWPSHGSLNVSPTIPAPRQQIQVSDGMCVRCQRERWISRPLKSFLVLQTTCSWSTNLHNGFALIMS